MGVREAIIQPSLKHLLDTKVTHNAYIVDDQGKEVQITTSVEGRMRLRDYPNLEQMKL